MSATKKSPRRKATTAKAKQAKVEEVQPVRLKPDHSRYTAWSDHRTASGRAVYDNGDEVAAKLRGMTLDETYAFAGEVLEEDPKRLREGYAHLNRGMQRMNLGNRIRKALKVGVQGQNVKSVRSSKRK